MAERWWTDGQGRERKDGEDHYQPGPGGPRADRPAGPGRLLHEPHRFHPHGHSYPARRPGRGARPDGGPAHSHPGQLSLHPSRPGGDPRRRADDPHPGARAGEHRRRRLPPAGPGHDCLRGSARRLPGPHSSEGRPGTAHRLSRRAHTATPDRRFPATYRSPARRPSAGRETIRPPGDQRMTTTRRDTAMHARQMTAMAEATRLTRQGRLLEATALIQQTLASPAVTRRAPDAPRAEEETSAVPGHSPDPPPARPAREGTQLRRVHSGWIPRRRTLPGRGAPGLRRPHRPAAPAVKPPAGRFDAFSYTNAAGTRAYRLYVPTG